MRGARGRHANVTQTFPNVTADVGQTPDTYRFLFKEPPAPPIPSWKVIQLKGGTFVDSIRDFTPTLERLITAIRLLSQTDTANLMVSTVTTPEGVIATVVLEFNRKRGTVCGTIDRGESVFGFCCDYLGPTVAFRDKQANDAELGCEIPWPASFEETSITDALATVADAAPKLRIRASFAAISTALSTPTPTTRRRCLTPPRRAS